MQNLSSSPKMQCEINMKWNRHVVGIDMEYFLKMWGSNFSEILV